MEISKEREAFEAEFSKIKSDIAFWLHTWDEEMQGYNHPVMCWFWYMWQAKKQATPEGFVLINRESLALHVQSIRLFNNNEHFIEEIENHVCSIEEMIEAQTQIKELKIEWACDCANCGHHEAIIYSTSCEAASKGWFNDGDRVKCCQCGHEGEMFADREDSDINWNEVL